MSEPELVSATLTLKYGNGTKVTVEAVQKDLVIKDCEWARNLDDPVERESEELVSEILRPQWPLGSRYRFAVTASKWTVAVSGSSQLPVRLDIPPERVET